MTAPSPFVEGTRLQYAWDSTSLGAFRECQRKYQYYILEGWRSRADSVHLTFGSHYHKGLERYEQLRAEGQSHDDAQREIVSHALYDTWEYDAEGRNGKPWSSEDTAKNRETLIRSLIWYTEKYRDDAAKTAILANGKAAVELSFRFDLGWKPHQYDKDGWIADAPNYLLCGHLDRIVEFQDGTYVLDHKTTGSTISSSYFDNYSPETQMSLYTIAAQVMWQAPVKGVLIAAAQIAVGFTRFERGFSYRTEAQMAEWMHDLKLTLEEAEEAARREYWKMNDKACRMCQFKKICSKDPSVRQRFLETDFVKKPWNPLEVR